MKFLKTSLIAITLTSASIAFAHGPRGYLEQVDTNKDGVVSKAESTQFAEARFAEADTNRDGVISEGEAQAVKQQRRVEFEKKAQERFASQDANNDGKLQKSEVPNMPDKLFARLDANNDGALSQEELRSHGPGKKGPRQAKASGQSEDAKADGERGHGKHGKRGFGKRGDLFKRMDTNQDGNVTKAEAQAASEQHFARLDRNNDGNITSDELPHRRMHGKKSPEARK